MDDAKLGAVIRAVRIRQHLTQAEVALKAQVGRMDVGDLERGKLNDQVVGVARRILAVLGMWVEMTPRYRGIDLDRLVGGPHDALQEALARWLRGVGGWEVSPEVTYAIFGERGAIDLLAWHAATRALLIIEVKTVVVEPAELVRKMDERQRLAPKIAAEHGWRPLTIARWVVFTETRTNRRHVALHADVLRPLMGADGRTMRAWMRRPDGAVSGLSFWNEPTAVIPRRIRCVRRGAMSRGASRGP